MKKVRSGISSPKFSTQNANSQWKQLASLLDTMAGKPTAEILDGLRQLERKTSLVFTLLKASVYSIVLQQEIYSGDQGGGQED
jgi:DASH complex subunit DAD3